jgi:hypothetical protein
MRSTVEELEKEARRARDEHGNTDFYAVLMAAAREVRYLREEIRGLGKMTRVCTRDILRETCGYCNCKYRPSIHGKGMRWAT